MTTEQPNPAQDQATPSGDRVLRRRSGERVIGGVASGLGEFLNVDPLLIRIAFVGLMVFGGLGLLLYVGAWLVIPDERTDDSIIEQLLDRSGLTASGVLLGLLLIAAVVLFIAGFNMVGTGLAVAFGVAVFVMVLGIVLFRQGQPGSMSLPRPRVDVPRRAERTRAAKVPVESAVVRKRARRRHRSPLGWFVLGTAFAAVGGLALLTNVTGADIDLGQYFGLALATLGIGLVVGTWWGHARVLILLGILLLPFAAVSAFVTAPIQGGVGDLAYRPANVAELQDEYRLVGGRLVLDLTGLASLDEPIEIAASVAAGQMRVVVPENAVVDVAAEVGAGELGILDAWQTGTGLQDRYVRNGSGPRIILDLEAGIGSLWLDAAGPMEPER